MNTASRRGPRVLAAVLILTALGIAAFWVNWFATGLHRSAEPECYRVFENTFPLPDGVMALAKLAAAALLLRMRAGAVPLCCFAAGMSWHLGALDTQYHLQHGHFEDFTDFETWSRIFICTHTLALGGVLIAYPWRIRRRLAQAAPAREVRPDRLLAAALFLCAIVTAAYWLGPAASLHAESPQCAKEFHAAFTFADALLGLTAMLGAAGLLAGRAWALPWAWAHAGLAAFGLLIHAAFSILNPALIADRQAGYAIALALVSVYLAFLVKRLTALPSS